MRPLGTNSQINYVSPSVLLWPSASAASMQASCSGAGHDDLRAPKANREPSTGRKVSSLGSLEWQLRVTEATALPARSPDRCTFNCGSGLASPDAEGWMGPSVPRRYPARRVRLISTFAQQMRVLRGRSRPHRSTSFAATRGRAIVEQGAAERSPGKP